MCNRWQLWWRFSFLPSLLRLPVREQLSQLQRDVRHVHTVLFPVPRTQPAVPEDQQDLWTTEMIEHFQFSFLPWQNPYLWWGCPRSRWSPCRRGRRGTPPPPRRPGPSRRGCPRWCRCSRWCPSLALQPMSPLLWWMFPSSDLPVFITDTMSRCWCINFIFIVLCLWRFVYPI